MGKSDGRNFFCHRIFFAFPLKAIATPQPKTNRCILSELIFVQAIIEQAKTFPRMDTFKLKSIYRII